MLTSPTHVFLQLGDEASSAAGRLVPLTALTPRLDAATLFLRGDEPPVRGIKDTRPFLMFILGEGREGFAFASRGARAARCLVGEAGIVVLLPRRCRMWY